jgi:hypothetical protein
MQDSSMIKYLSRQKLCNVIFDVIVLFEAKEMLSEIGSSDDPAYYLFLFPQFMCTPFEKLVYSPFGSR